METLLLLMFVLVWAGMWYCVVKNRGTWPLLFGHLAGIVSGFIVAFVVYMIMNALFPEQKTTPASPAAAIDKPASPPKNTDTQRTDELLSFVAHTPVVQTPAPDSPLLPGNSERYPSLSTPLLATTLEPEWQREYTKARGAADMVKGNNSMLANLMCRSVGKKALRFPESAAFDDLQYYRFDRFKSQTYTVLNRVRGQNMEGTVVNLGFDCTVQFISGNGLKDDQWKLLELTMRGQQSLSAPTATSADSELPEYIASESRDTPASPDSALRNDYRDKILSTLSESTIVDGMSEQQRATHLQLRNNITPGPDANKKLIAFMMCEPFVRNAVRYPQSILFGDSKSLMSQRYKDQIYTSANYLKVKNHAGDYVGYRFECTLQATNKSDGHDDWKLLDLKFEQNGN